MKFKLVGIGEVLWDLLPTGPQMGGAPANFAYHASALGGDGTVISRVGNDDLGREIIARLQNLGVPTNCIETDSAAPTGTVSVDLGANGEPRYTIHENVAWDFLSADANAKVAVSAANAVCFGSLAQRSEPSRTSIRELVRRASPAALRIFDINLRQHYFSRQVIEESLTLANVLKVNETELPKLSEMFSLSGDHCSQIQALAERFDLGLVAFTRGGEGSALYRNGEWSEHSGIRAEVVDTIGAGDSFTAAMAIGLLAGWELGEVNARANQVAAFVCSAAGATPPLPAQLRELFQRV
ncbi:MAG TPA: carbohydrate kinase [Candidatus Saccharimonadales bacterium]|nr:carbohydrate kinase [Candidatus Saccharimonadales bacterium]